jgi:hypothetical protein
MRVLFMVVFMARRVDLRGLALVAVGMQRGASAMLLLSVRSVFYPDFG